MGKENVKYLIMDYIKHYRKLIESRLILNRSKNNGIYYEKHHIIPKSLGGSNSSKNLILLTAKEHFIAHLLLHYARPHSKSLAFGLWCLYTMSNGYKIKSSRLFSYLREKVLKDFNPGKKELNRINSSKRMIENNPTKGKVGPNKGLNVSQLYGDKISKGLKKYFETNTNAFLNKKHSKESIDKIKLNNGINKKIEINGVIYNSILEASRQLNIKHGRLYRQINGQNPNIMNIKVVEGK